MPDTPNVGPAVPAQDNFSKFLESSGLKEAYEASIKSDAPIKAAAEQGMKDAAALEATAPSIDEINKARSDEKLSLDNLMKMEYKPEPFMDKKKFGEFSSMLVLMAAIAGVGPGNHFANALSAFSGGMEGYVRGRQDLLKQNMEDFKIHYEKGVNDFKLRNERTKQLVADKTLPLDMKLKFGQLYMQVGQGQFKTIADLVNMQMTNDKMVAQMNQHYTEFLANYQQKEKQFELSMRKMDLQNKHWEAMFNLKKDQIANPPTDMDRITAKNVIAGRKDLMSVPTRNGERSRVNNAINEIDPTWDGTTVGLGILAKKTLARAENSMPALKLRAAVESLTDKGGIHERLRQMRKDLPDTGFPPLNRAEFSAMTWAGDPQSIAFGNLLLDAGEMKGMILQGGGTVTTDTKMVWAYELYQKAASSPEALDAALKADEITFKTREEKFSGQKPVMPGGGTAQPGKGNVTPRNPGESYDAWVKRTGG